MRSGTDHVPPEVFWRIVDRYEIKPHDELFWLHVIPLMVEHEHKNGVRAGAALFRVGVSAARIERWLRLDRPAALAEARRLLTRVNSGFDWPRFGKLLLFWNDPARMAFARDFFLAHSPTKHDDQSTKGGE
jgi:CRISPR type I-E-associated protein CasB/Cse2